MAATLAVHRGTWRVVDRYVALTDRIAEHLRDFGIPDERITVKPNGIPDPGPRRRRARASSSPAGSDPEKGLELLLDAWRRHPDGALGPLRITGDGAAAAARRGRPPPTSRHLLSRVLPTPRCARRSLAAAVRDRRLDLARRAADHRAGGAVRRPAGAGHRPGRAAVPRR